MVMEMVPVGRCVDAPHHASFPRAAAPAEPIVDEAGGRRSGEARSIWYCAAPGAGRRPHGDHHARPTGVAHAKTTGGLLTACGLNAASWTKYLEIDFTSYQGKACAACAAAVVPTVRGDQRFSLLRRCGGSETGQ